MPVTSYPLGSRTLGNITLQYKDGSGNYQTITTTNGQANPVSTWIGPTSDDGTQIKEFQFNAVTTQAIRVTIGTANSEGWTYMEEIQVYGP